MPINALPFTSGIVRLSDKKKIFDKLGIDGFEMK